MDTAYLIDMALISILPLAFLYIVYQLDLYSSGSLKVMGGMVVWGGVSFLLALEANTWLVSAAAVSFAVLSMYVAPVVEECLKGGTVILVNRRKAVYMVDGALYGASVGIGFAICENILYIGMVGDSGLVVGLSRLLTATLMHTSATAFLGVMVGRSKMSTRRGWIPVAGGLAGAVGLHMGYNIILHYNAGAELPVAIAMAFTYYALIWKLIAGGIKDEQEWIKRNLLKDTSTTRQEVDLLLKEEDFNEGLDIIEERFGKEKRKKVREYLMLEAKIGILRKALETNDDTAISREVDSLRSEANAIKKELGIYCMAFVRSLFPQDDEGFWNDLASRLDDSEGEGNIFHSLDEFDDEYEIDEDQERGGGDSGAPSIPRN